MVVDWHDAEATILGNSLRQVVCAMLWFSASGPNRGWAPETNWIAPLTQLGSSYLASIQYERRFEA